MRPGSRRRTESADCALRPFQPPSGSHGFTWPPANPGKKLKLLRRLTIDGSGRYHSSFAFGPMSNARPSGGQVAQLVEHRTENPGVAGSIPALSTKSFIGNALGLGTVFARSLHGFPTGKPPVICRPNSQPIAPAATRSVPMAVDPADQAARIAARPSTPARQCDHPRFQSRSLLGHRTWRHNCSALSIEQN